ncbi:hypothetical protein HPB50_015896 [Hyalomma asiaticum]|uniref:Uncharacterized protein n=1 Tax=Hyalomma asiaticum TaxID=266040 RepID=A0ACB7SF81_HYAAI|nr:hypothetical protein HPB50_015896 [Hyalomma asiaticum]
MTGPLKPGAFLKKDIPNLLVFNSFRGHLTAKVKAVLWKECTDMLVIPCGLTGQLQPLDMEVNKPFKDLLGREYRCISMKNRELTQSRHKSIMLGREYTNIKYSGELPAAVESAGRGCATIPTPTPLDGSCKKPAVLPRSFLTDSVPKWVICLIFYSEISQ